jgi:capsular exopolysaccharide synthesis family protein
VNQLSAHPQLPTLPPTTGPLPAKPDDELRAGVVWRAMLRHRWTVLVCVLLGAGLAFFLTHRATRIYTASAVLRIDDKQPNLPEVFRTLSSGGEVATEAEVVRSRVLAEDVVDSLGLQLTLAGPNRVERSQVLERPIVERDAPARRYQLVRRDDGVFDILADSMADALGSVRPGTRVQLPGASFRLLPAATAYARITLDIRPFDRAVDAVLADLHVAQPSRDTKILQVRYDAPDRQLAYRVPNLLVDRFVARRQDVQRSDALKTVAFLRKQVDSVAAQLETSEEKLRRYREQSGAIDPTAEANSQVSRLINSQTERSAVNAERDALSRMLADADAKAAKARPEDPSPYRDLLAFPTLMRNSAARELLQALSDAEQQRTALLARRKPTDLDVQALSKRVDQVQGELRGVVATYLQGLTNQVATLDTNLAQFGRQLGALPTRQLEVARLEREPKVLGDIYSLLQTRLKEAEIAAAANDPSVRVVDRAVAPQYASSPKPLVNLFVGLVGGLMLGLGVVAVRELLDRSIHTQSDVQLTTGLPVLGLIPRIDRHRGGVALIAERRRLSPAAAVAALPKPAEPPPSPAPGTGLPRRTYTFLTGSDSESDQPAAGVSEPPPPVVVAPPPPVLQLVVSDVGSAATEAYDMLQTNLAFSRPADSVKTIVLTSPLPGDGKTTSAINLAVTLSRRGLKVLLIDADLRRSVVHKIFGVSRHPGLSEVLRGDIPLAQACRAVAVEHGEIMHVVTAGRPVPNPIGVLESEAMRALITQQREVYDTIVIDCPPANIVTDAAVLGSYADGILVVARAGLTESGALAYAMQQLQHVRGRVLGVLLNDIDDRDASYDPNYRYHDYRSYSSSSSD